MLELCYLGAPQDLSLLLQGGFSVRATVGCTLREFLCMEMEICGDYAEKRIQTIFIDGHPVDDFDDAVVADGTELALSGAMPGLVGAMLRRGGGLGVLRDSITYHLDELRPEATQGRVRLKLYNFIAEELAPVFLRRGVIIDAGRLAHALSKGWLDANRLRAMHGSGTAAPLQAEALQALPEHSGEVRIRAPQTAASA